jgi:hypothetical protein
MKIVKQIEIKLTVLILNKSVANILLDGDTISIIKFDRYTYSNDMAVFYLNNEAIADYRYIESLKVQE